MSTQKIKIEYFTVVGRGDFPFDMLRYDSCCPDRAEDAHNLRSEIGQREVRLRRYAVSGLGPTEARWLSFGWAIMKDDYGNWDHTSWR